MFNFTLNKNAIAVCQALQNRGFQAYLVGGCVRDLLMQQIPHDWDIATSALPNQVIDIFRQTYPTGIQHGTISVMSDTELFEVTTFRTEGTYSDGRHPDQVAFVSSITDDLARRDFTINAIAYDPVHHQLVDPFHGHDDINNKIIRAVGNPMERFEEDGLRIMRAARFASRLQFTVDDATRVCMKAANETLTKVSMERIRDELIKTLNTAKPSIGLELLYQSGIFELICPAIKNEREQFEKLFHNLDIHPREIQLMMETKLAYLIHTQKDKLKLLREMKFSNQEIERIDCLHALFNCFLRHQDRLENEGYSARLLLGAIKNEAVLPFEEALEQFLCYLFIWNPDYKKKVDAILHYPVLSRKDLAIKGGDVMTLGIAPGPMIKTVLGAAYNQILQYPEQNNKEDLLRFAKGFVEGLKEK